MATRHRLDHDLDPNQHRYLGGRGADATYTAGGDLTLGHGNYFKITPTSTATLRRISGTDWTAGSPVVLEPTVATTFAPGTSSGGGMYGVTTPTGDPVVVEAGVPVALSFDGSLWKLHKAAMAYDDHLVKARNADATTVGGLMEKTIDSETVTREQITDGGIEKVRFNAVPATPPAGEGSWLYTGSIQASNLLDPVVAHVKTGSGGGAQDSAGIDWKPLGNGDLEHWDWTGGNPATHTGGSPLVGELHGLDTTGSSTIDLNVGDRVWMTYTESAVVDGETVYYRRGGICTVITLGDASTAAVLRQVSADMVTGNMFSEVGVGAEFEGWWFEIDADYQDGYYLGKRDYVNETTYNLFTSTQVSQAGSVTRETSVTIPGGTSGGTMFVVPYFEMLEVLGVSTIPKGVVNWEVKAYVVADDPAATVFIRAFLTTDTGILDRFGYGDTPPIHNTSAAILRMQGTISADRTVSSSAKLGAVFYGYSDSASEVTIKLVFNDASHSTRVQTPLTTASFGTLDHGLLTPVSRKFPNTDQGQADAVEWAHPQDGIQPGRIQTPANPNVTSVDGLFAVPLDSNFVVLEGTENLIGCSTDGWTGPGWIEVHILNERDILKSQSPLPAGYAPFMWGSTDTDYGAAYDVQTAYAGSIFRFRWTGGVWRIAGVMNM